MTAMALDAGDDAPPATPVPAYPAQVDLPVRRNDWVSDGQGRVAMVRDVHRARDGVFVDLWLYDHHGNRTGRESPACGGPRTFEPWCDWQGWHRIGEPTFPVPLRWVTDGDGRRTARRVAGARLPDRAWAKPVRVAPAAVRAVVVQANLDPVGEALAMRIAAQRMRDVARRLVGEAAEAVRAEARGLEDEAERLSPRP